MSEPRLCPQCGGEIPEDAPAGLCPKCLVLAGLESRPSANAGTAATQPPPSSASTGFVPLTVEEVAAKFPQLEIIELLGRGGMGAVYKARQMELDRLVAIKILPPEVSRAPAFSERFNREARAMARLGHPNIVAIHDIGRTTDGLFYFVMEYVDGVNLRQAIQAGHMDPKQALSIVPQICDALQFAHDEGVVHRDIKPENILIDKRGRVKIADFGLAKLLGQEAADHSLTATQQVLGTLRYMSPEQLEGTKTVDHRADIYSLGVVFYELLTGELPIGRFAPPSKMVEIDVRLDEVVLRALEKKPEQRYQHASEVKTDVDQIRSVPVAASKGSVAAGAANDRGFVAAVATALVAAWIALLIGTNGDNNLPIDLRPPAMLIGFHLLFPLAIAALAGGVFVLIWPRPNESFLDRIVRPAPMLIGCHLLMFSMAIFTSGHQCLEWDRVTFQTPDVGIPQLQPREEVAYQVGPWKTWVGPVAVVAAGVGLLALLLTLGSPPRLRARAAILIFVGLINIGAVAEYMALRPPKTSTFTRERYRAFDPDHADGNMYYDRFIREADADFEALRSMPYNPSVNPRLINGNDYNLLKIEHSKVIVHHYFQDEVAWFLLPGGLLLLCGLATWRQAAAVEQPAAGSRIAPLAAIGAFVGIAGPLACAPGLVVAFLMLDQKESLWGGQPSMAFLMGFIGMLVFSGISLLAMTVLGAAAIGQIRRSGGKFYGLRLALLEALFCPAIALYCAAFGVLCAILMAGNSAQPSWGAFLALFAIMVLVVISAIVLIYWRLYTKLTRPPGESGAMEEKVPSAVAASPVAVPSQLAAIGKASLWSSIAGLVAPLLLAAIGSLLTKSQNVGDNYYFLWCFALGVVLELVALVCGIVARRTATGRVGLVISIISLALAGLMLAWSTEPQPRLPNGMTDEITASSGRSTSDQSSATPAIAAPGVANPFDLHPGKQVSPTPKELAHILAEVALSQSAGLLGDDAQSIKDLDTQVYAIDFDDGPADFWLQVRETGQQTFPVRLPSRNDSKTWRIPKKKAHILMWIQPRQSVAMKDRVRFALAMTAPGCSLGIDVDGKSVARVHYDVPVGGVNQATPHPLWFGWASREIQAAQAADLGFDREMASQAMLYLAHASSVPGQNLSCQLGLMYRPDRVGKKSDR
jgi:tRNA A-37 threonylcarbamoyl transferase component Bud32